MRPPFGGFFFLGKVMADEFGLSVRQRRFVEHFIVSGNATQAYIAAGYSPKNAGPDAGKTLKKPKVSEAIEALRPKTELAIEEMITPQDVINGLMAETRGEHAATRVAAWRELGRVLGLFIDKSQSNVTHTTYADELESLADEIKARVDAVPKLKVVNG